MERFVSSRVEKIPEDMGCSVLKMTNEDGLSVYPVRTGLLSSKLSERYSVDAAH